MREADDGSGHGGDVDDGAAAGGGDHVGRAGLAGDEGAGDVDVEEAAEFVNGVVFGFDVGAGMEGQ